MSVASACGGPCHNVISAQRSILDQKAATSDGRPHAQLRLPHNRLNVVLNQAIAREQPSVELSLSSVVPLPTAVARASRLEVITAEDGSLGFDVEISVSIGEQSLLSMSATIAARTTTSLRDGRSILELGFDADSLRTVTPQYPDGAVRALATALGPVIKAASGKDVPAPLLAPITRRLLNHLTNEAFALVRDKVLARVGEVAKLSIDLGRAPVARLETRSYRGAQPALLVDVYTTLPVRVGLSPQPHSPDPVSGTGRLRVAGDVVAELGNWAIAEGLAPQAYDSKLKPDPDGAYVPVYGWRDGDLPLVVHAFRIEPPCSTVVIGARPEVRVDDGKLTVAITDGNIESVEGSTLMRLGVGLKSIFGGDIEKSESGAAGASFEVGGRPVQATLIDAAIGGGELDLTVQLALPPA